MNNQADIRVCLTFKLTVRGTVVTVIKLDAAGF